MDKLKYPMNIQCSKEDNCYLVGLLDFLWQQWRTHGDTYFEAVANGVEVLELLIKDYQLAGEPLPNSTVFNQRSNLRFCYFTN